MSSLKVILATPDDSFKPNEPTTRITTSTGNDYLDDRHGGKSHHDRH